MTERRDVQKFIKHRLKPKIAKDLKHSRIFNEADLQSVVYLHIRRYLAHDKRWKIFNQPHISKIWGQKKTINFFPDIVLAVTKPRISIELKEKRGVKKSRVVNDAKKLFKLRKQGVIRKGFVIYLFQIIKKTKELIEKETSNDVFVNLASGSKIQAIALMMTCMMFGKEKRITPFYAEAKDYPGFAGKQMSYGVKNIMQVPIYKMQTPKAEHIKALKIINENKGRITKKLMAKLAKDEELIVVNAKKDNESQATFASLDKNIIQPLEEQWKFIKIEKVGRNRWIQITQEGLNAAEFLT